MAHGPTVRRGPAQRPGPRLNNHVMMPLACPLCRRNRWAYRTRLREQSACQAEGTADPNPCFCCRSWRSPSTIDDADMGRERRGARAREKATARNIETLTDTCLNRCMQNNSSPSSAPKMMTVLRSPAGIHADAEALVRGLNKRAPISLPRWSGCWPSSRTPAAFAQAPRRHPCGRRIGGSWKRLSWRCRARRVRRSARAR